METSQTSTDRTGHPVTMTLVAGLLGLAATLSPGPAVAQEENPERSVHLILSDDGASYRAFERGFRQRLARSPATMPVETTLTPSDDSNPESDASVIVVAVGTSALESVIDNTEGPVVAAMVPSWIVARWQARRSDRRITGIFIDQPAHRHVTLVRALIPTAESIGLLSGMENMTESGFPRAAEEQGFALSHETATDRSSLLQGVRQLARENDAIIVLPSPLTTEARNLRGLLLQSFRAGVPVIGFSPGLVEAGAVAAVYSEPEGIGADTAALLENIGNSSPSDWPAARYPDHFQVAVNRQVARAIGLSIPPHSDLYAAIDRSRP